VFLRVGVGGGGRRRGALIIVCLCDYAITVVYCVMYVKCVLVKNNQT
jgi:hypothetical protein